MSRVYLSAPHMGDEERRFLLEAFDSNWIAPLGPHVEAFESEFSQTVGLSDSVSLSSGTAGLHLALLVLGVGEGDEVLVSDLTFAATANAVRYVGARPRFIDSNSETWTIDPDLVADDIRQAARQGRTPKALIAVDLYGQCADYDALHAICDRYEIPIIEDAAESLGATYRGRPAGSLGLIGVFSFNGNKIITTSGGGMLCSNDVTLVERARYLATQARERTLHYEHHAIGYNYRMSNLLAAVGRGQLTHLRQRIDRRREINEFYRDHLSDLPGIEFMPAASYGTPTFWLTCLIVDEDSIALTRDSIIEALEEADIEARPTWKPMHLQPIFTGSPIRGGAVSARLFRSGICLPSGSGLLDSELHSVVKIIRSLCESNPLSHQG